mmetsp:Transcript_21934/g.46141  ORF Transcript_21934/g.46141 Transcript_21934/m.46141 type:complete len:96 (-) Transcript_21934:1402-1689(-)
MVSHGKNSQYFHLPHPNSTTDYEMWFYPRDSYTCIDNLCRTTKQQTWSIQSVWTRKKGSAMSTGARRAVKKTLRKFPRIENGFQKAGDDKTLCYP